MCLLEVALLKEAIQAAEDCSVVWVERVYFEEDQSIIIYFRGRHLWLRRQ